MKHILDRDAAMKGSEVPVCRSATVRGDTLVVSALESDCIPCRNKLGIGPPEQRGCAIRETLDYVGGVPLVDANGNVIKRDA